MFEQDSKAARNLRTLIERVGDQIGLLFLLALGVTTAGATLLAGI